MPEITSRRILIAASDLFFAAKILDAAKRAQMQAEMVGTSEALREKLTPAPALVIFDLNFAAIDPLRMIAEMKSRPETRDTPVIAFVSHVQADLRNAAQNAGCDEVLARSAFAQKLPAILQRYVSSV
jgi:CheY-like chemotaxis protein